MSETPYIRDLGEGVNFMALGARVERLVHPVTVGSQQLGVSMVHMAPGERVKRHRHEYEEAYYVVAGVGVMYLEGVGEVELFPGRAVYVPPQMVHGQVNTSTDEKLLILCSLSPPPPDGLAPETFE